LGIADFWRLGMAYKYFTAGSPTMLNTPKDNWVNDFQDILDANFYNASDVFTIRHETFFSSGSYIDIDVRINSAIDSATGEKLGDDFKNLLFQSIDVAPKKGEKFYFDNNYWLVVNTDNIKSLAATCTIRRCNNVLRWTDETGNLYYEHCIIDYRMSTTRNRVRSDPLVPDGTIKIFTQLNTQTKTIKENQRFLFGNPNQWVAYMIYGGGISNFLNNITIDNNSSQFMELNLGKNYVNENTDNIALGIADYYKYSADSLSVNNIKILPDVTKIIEGNTQSYSCYLYNAGIQLGDTFVFSISGSSLVPSANYVLTTVDGNHFNIENISKFLDSSLIISCVSGVNSRDFKVDLRGAW
jgi:hypothetical protein